MAGYSELIKKFSKTRDYLSDFFIYGNKLRGEVGKKSSRTYDDEKRRAESWLGEYVRHEDTALGRQISITVDSGHISENPLYRAYRSKSFTANDIRLHFLLTDILSDGSAHTTKELTELLMDTYSFPFDEQTVRNKLSEYVKEGIVIKEKSGRNLLYKLSDETVADLIGRFRGLADAVTFFSETQWFGFVGNTILRVCGLKNEMFLMKHNYIVHTLEDDILEQIMAAMDEHRFVSTRSFSVGEDGKQHRMLPIKILVSTQTGRRYLAGFTEGRKKPYALRLDFVKQVTLLEVCEDYGERCAEFAEVYKHCFGVSFGSDSVTELTTVKIVFHADEKFEQFIIERIKREMRGGTLSRIEENRFLLTEELYDAGEMMHWVKSFIGRIESFECNDPKITQRFEDDVMLLHEMYGGDGNGDIQ